MVTDCGVSTRAQNSAQERCTWAYSTANNIVISSTSGFISDTFVLQATMVLRRSLAWSIRADRSKGFLGLGGKVATPQRCNWVGLEEMPNRGDGLGGHYDCTASAGVRNIYKHLAMFVVYGCQLFRFRQALRWTSREFMVFMISVRSGEDFNTAVPFLLTTESIVALSVLVLEGRRGCIHLLLKSRVVTAILRCHHVLFRVRSCRDQSIINALLIIGTQRRQVIACHGYCIRLTHKLASIKTEYFNACFFSPLIQQSVLEWSALVLDL